MHGAGIVDGSSRLGSCGNRGWCIASAGSGTVRCQRRKRSPVTAACKPVRDTGAPATKVVIDVLGGFRPVSARRSPTPVLRRSSRIRKLHFCSVSRRRVHLPRRRGTGMKTRSLKQSGSPEAGTPQASVGPASSQATASTIAHKYRRALKNGTGATLTFLELQLLARLGAMDLVTRAENAELMNWQEILAGSSSGPLARPQPWSEAPQHLLACRKISRQTIEPI
jgi:hypothetical protein